MGKQRKFFLTVEFQLIKVEEIKELENFHLAMIVLIISGQKKSINAKTSG